MKWKKIFKTVMNKKKRNKRNKRKIRKKNLFQILTIIIAKKKK